MKNVPEHTLTKHNVAWFTQQSYSTSNIFCKTDSVDSDEAVQVLRLNFMCFPLTINLQCKHINHWLSYLYHTHSLSLSRQTWGCANVCVCVCVCVGGFRVFQWTGPAHRNNKPVGKPSQEPHQVNFQNFANKWVVVVANPPPGCTRPLFGGGGVNSVEQMFATPKVSGGGRKTFRYVSQVFL